MTITLAGNKALSKQEGPNICWDARFLNPFFEFLISSLLEKKGFKNRASLQEFGPSYFVRALACSDLWSTTGN